MKGIMWVGSRFLRTFSLCALPLLILSAVYAQRREVVVVTGVYEPAPLEEADRSVRVIGVRDQLLLSNSIIDLLRLDPSIDLRQRAPGGIQADVSVRGGTFGQTLVLLDGLRLNDAQTGHHNLDLPLPLEGVSRIEVLRGAGSTLYGSDAVGGVINLVTAPPESSEIRLRTGVGNFGVNQQRLTASAVRGRWTQLLSASRDFSSGFRPNRDYRNLTLASSTGLSTALGTTSLLLGHSDRPFGAQNFYGNYPSWERTRVWYGAIRQPLGERTQVSFAGRRHTDLFVLYRDRPQVFTNRHLTEAYQLAFRRREDLGANTRLHYGAEGLRDRIQSTNLGRHRRHSGALYGAADFRALGRFSLSLGAREQFYGSRQSAFSPTAAAGLWLNRRLKIRASASRAFRLPSYTDLYYQDPGNRGSPDLRPEKAWSYETGAGWYLSDRLQADLTLFHRRETDGIDYVRRSPADIWRATNIQRLRFTGLEAAFTARLRRLQTLEFYYTALRGARESLGDLQSRYVFNYPVHSGLAGYQAALPAGLALRFRLGVTQRLGRDAYSLADVYLARTRGRLRPFLQLTNLGNTRYEEILNVAMPGRGVLAGLEYAFSF